MDFKALKTWTAIFCERPTSIVGYSAFNNTLL